MKLTKAVVDRAEPPKDKDQIFYRDDELKGFALRVTARSKELCRGNPDWKQG